jgi:Flp pilus assembly protein TadG
MNRLRSEGGAVELIVAFALFALLGFAALVVDIGNAKQTRRNFQTAADSGSLAGASELPAASAKVTAADYAFDSMNQPRGTQLPSCPADRTSDPKVPNSNTTCYQATGDGPIVYVTTPYRFTPPPGIEQPRRRQTINVTICQTLQTTFARVLGIDTTHPCNSATAEKVSGASTAAAVKLIG